MNKRLYLDNAATSFPKPPSVIDAMRAYADELGASAGRGAYREALETGELLSDCRRRLARLIGAGAPAQIAFTLNCTHALNIAIKGVLRPGDHVVATVMEHNSVLRPLNALVQERGIRVTVVAADEQGRVSADAVRHAIRPETRLVTLVHASNVTGTLQPVEDIGAEARHRGALFLVDASQTAGHVPIDVAVMKIDLLAMPGHKALLGPLGTGALYIRDGLVEQVPSLMEGGTGSISEEAVQPGFLPDKYEAGSHNAIGIAGLRAALAWVENETVKALRSHDIALSTRFIERAAGITGLTIHGPTDPRQRVSVFSIRVDGLEPAELSAVLDAEFDICTRSGLHCAPLAHRAVGTLESGGSTRISFGALNNVADVDRCVDALQQVATLEMRPSHS